MGLEWLKPAAFLGSILFALIGVLIFWICFLIIDKLTPYDLWGEIVEKQNVALALVVAAMSLGLHHRRRRHPRVTGYRTDRGRRWYGARHPHVPEVRSGGCAPPALPAARSLRP